MASARRPVAAPIFMATVALFALLLAGEAVRRTLAHRYAERDPILALRWEPSDAAARETLANRRLALAMTTRSPATQAAALVESQAQARRALAAGPLHEAALRDLGLAANLSGDSRRATRVMARAALRGRRDVADEGWWLRRALTTGDTAGAVSRLDAMLRVEPDLEPRLFPVISALLSVPDGRAALARSLLADPIWRQQTLDDVASKAPDLDAVGQLFAALGATGSPPSDSQSGAFLTRLALTGRYGDAKALWARSTPDAGSSVPYDGEFRNRRGSPPFNWRIVRPGSGAAEMGPAPGAGSALLASYPSSEAPLIAEQMVTLAPGAYRLSGRWRVERPAAGAAVSWTLTCAGAVVPIGEWRRGTDLVIDWTAFDLAFVVPDNCEGQWLRLQGRAGDGFDEVSTAFTGLRIEPAAR